MECPICDGMYPNLPNCKEIAAEQNKKEKPKPKGKYIGCGISTGNVDLSPASGADLEGTGAKGVARDEKMEKSSLRAGKKVDETLTGTPANPAPSFVGVDFAGGKERTFVNGKETTAPSICKNCEHEIIYEEEWKRWRHKHGFIPKVMVCSVEVAKGKWDKKLGSWEGRYCCCENPEVSK
ncbi:MAG: hypothetical protein PHN89_04465 [Candidatus Pacebacteria bacterium]|nr:hypothetical protein [Candidatus Paceibacterota bacterium]